MYTHEEHTLAGDDLEERGERLKNIAASRRQKNRDAMIPDMEPQRHEPVEWFAEVGFHHILSIIRPSQPVDDWSEEGGQDSDREKYLEARIRDAFRVKEYLCDLEIKPIAQTSNGVRFGDKSIWWMDRIPGLKTWAGNQTMTKIMKERQSLLKKSPADFSVMTYEAAVGGASGMDRRTCPTALDLGFSANDQGMDTMTHVGLEMLAAIGIETAPITVMPDGSFIYFAGGKRWRFSRQARNDYYGRWSQAEEVR